MYKPLSQVFPCPLDKGDITMNNGALSWKLMYVSSTTDYFLGEHIPWPPFITSALCEGLRNAVCPCCTWALPVTWLHNCWHTDYEHGQYQSASHDLQRYHDIVTITAVRPFTFFTFFTFLSFDCTEQICSSWEKVVSAPTGKKTLTMLWHIYIAC